MEYCVLPAVGSKWKSDRSNIENGHRRGHLENHVITNPPERKVLTTRDLY